MRHPALMLVAIRLFIIALTVTWGGLTFAEPHADTRLGIRPDCENATGPFGRRNCLNAFGHRAVLELRRHVPAERLALIDHTVESIRRLERGLIAVEHDRGRAVRARVRAGRRPPVILYVQGYYFEDADEWFRPFARWLGMGIATYIFRWHHAQGLQEVSRSIVDAIGRIHMMHPEREVIVIAFCSGGIPATLAWQTLQSAARTPQELATFTRSHRLVTVATPFDGYGAPGFADVLDHVYGPIAVDIGQGTGGRELEHSSLSACAHHVTTDCRYDINACNFSHLSPSPQQLSHMPCLEQPVTAHPELTHIEVLDSVVERTLREAGLQPVWSNESAMPSLIDF